MSTIVTRAGKGSALTHNEVDANFTNLNTDKVEKSGTDPVVIAVNSTSDALRITQLGTGNALLVEDSTNPDSTPFVIDANGNLLNGYTSTLTTRISATSITPRTQFIGDSNNTVSAAIFAGTANPTFYFAKSGGTVASPTTVVSGNIIGRISSAGYDGTQFTEAAQITVEVDGTPGTNDMPGRLVFSTTADGASSPTERMRITSAGNVGIGTSSPGGYGKLVSLGGDNATLFAVVGATNMLRVQGYNSTYVGTVLEAVNLAQSANTPMFINASEIKLGTNGTERARIDSSGNLKFNSGYGSVATAYGCRAWVNFNGTGTVAILASGNVSSITDNGTGNYTVNFTTAMPDVNYATVGSVWNTVDNGLTTQYSTARVAGIDIKGASGISTGSVAVITKATSTDVSPGNVIDFSGVFVSVFR